MEPSTGEPESDMFDATYEVSVFTMRDTVNTPDDGDLQLELVEIGVSDSVQPLAKPSFAPAWQVRVKRSNPV